MTKFKSSGENSAEELLKSILRSAFNGIMTFTAVRDKSNEIIDFEWVFINDIAEKIVGLSNEDLIGQRLLTIMPTNEETGLFDRYKKVVNTGEIETFEHYYEDENLAKWFRISAVKLNDGFTVTFQDVSDLKEAILESQAKEKRYKKLFNESLDAIFLIDENWQFIDVNPVMLSLFGHSSNEFLLMKVDTIFSEEKELTVFKERLLTKNKVEELEVILLASGGKKKSCLLNCVTTPDEDLQENHFIGVIRDMTKKKQADKELIMAEKLSMTGKIARTIAHEVRNPLTNLTLALEQLKDEIPATVEDADLYFNIISRNAERISKLISDLLNSSKPKALTLLNLSLNDITKDTLKLVSDRLKLQSITLKESYSDLLPLIPLDKDQIKVALLNLFINAIEAMKPEIGVLNITTDYVDEYVQLIIADNGKGMSQDQMSQLFEPFFTGKKEGTGLGLTTVQNIIQSHRGTISAESELNRGTVFKITFR